MTSGISLQAAYDCGNEIQAGTPVVVKSNPGDGRIAGHVISEMLQDALVVASGFSPTTGLEPYAAMGPGFLGLQGSGVGGGSCVIESLKAPLIGQATLIGVDGKLIVFANGSTVLLSQNNAESVIEMTDGNISIRSYGGQGQLEYRLGAYEGWQVKSNTNVVAGPLGDGWLPIPHSGQIQEMINAAVRRGVKQHKNKCHNGPSGVTC